ncbi:MAG: YfhO family protein [Chitinophagales bacterium]
MAKVKAATSKPKENRPTSSFMKYAPYLAAVLTFIIVTFIFFGPRLTDDKTIPQGDIAQFDGMSKEIVDFRAQHHAEPLWSGSMFGGMPAFQISTNFEGNLVRIFDKVVSLGFPEYTGFLFTAAICFFLLLLVMDVNAWLAIAGGLAYALMSYNVIIIEAGHNTKMHAIALLPLVVAGFMLLWKERYWLGAAVSALGFSLLIWANHVQIAYYLFITLFILGVVEFVFAIREKQLKRYILAFGIFAGCGVLGLLSNASLLWSTYDYGNSTIRGKSELTSNTQSKGGLDRDYAFGWSYGKMEAFTLLIPNVYGGSSHGRLEEDGAVGKALSAQNVAPQQIAQYLHAFPLYWGDQPFTSGPVYAGAIICFLFVLGLFLVEGPMRWWLGIATLLSILLSFGHNLPAFNNLIFDFFPGYNKFRTVTMVLIIAQFAMPLLALLGVSKILRGNYNRENAMNALYVAAGITAGICLVFAVAGPSMFSFSGAGDKQLPEWLIKPLKDDRASLLRSDAIRSFVLIMAMAGLVWALIQEKVSKNIFTGAVILLVAIDFIGIDTRFINSDTFTDQQQMAGRFTPTPADEQIMADKTPGYRVFNQTVNTFNDASTSYHHKSIGGYHAAKLRRYQELIENQIQKGNMAVLNMLNTKYVIQQGAGGAPAVAQNPGALGNAWFVDQVQLVNNADEEMKAMDKFDPSATAIVDKRFQNDIGGFSGGKDVNGTIKVLSYQSNDIVYETHAAKDQFAVFSEIYYQPGWKATVDGKELPIVRANYVLRAAKIPAGDHKVEMKFEPASFYTGEKISYASSALVFILLGAGLFFEWRKRQQPVAVA